MGLKKNSILIACIIICIVIGTGIVITLLQSQDTAAKPQLQENRTAGTPVPPIASTPQTIHPPDIPLTVTITRDEATARVQEEYSRGYSITAVHLTGLYPGKILYEFTMVPAESSLYEKNTTVFIDADTGDLYSPLQEKAGISIEQAKLRAREAFPAWTIDRVRIKYVDGTQYVRSWEFYLYMDDKELVHGSLDADTGELSDYAIGVTRTGRPENPSITTDAAQQVADREIEERNGVIPIVLGDSRLDPLGMPGEKIAGRYVFVYNRVIRNVPCDSDGFTIVVDSVAGNVIEYRKSWSLPENAVALSAKPAKPRMERQKPCGRKRRIFIRHLLPASGLSPLNYGGRITTTRIRLSQCPEVSRLPGRYSSMMRRSGHSSGLIREQDGLMRRVERFLICTTGTNPIIVTNHLAVSRLRSLVFLIDTGAGQYGCGMLDPCANGQYEIRSRVSGAGDIIITDRCGCRIGHRAGATPCFY